MEVQFLLQFLKYEPLFLLTFVGHVHDKKKDSSLALRMDHFVKLNVECNHKLRPFAQAFCDLLQKETDVVIEFRSCLPGWLFLVVLVQS